MTFLEAENSLNQDFLTADIELKKAIVVAESSYREFNLNCKKAELKVIQESGTDEDLQYFYEEATEGFINKALASIKKAIESLLELIKSTVEKIQTSFGEKKAQIALEKMEKAAKTNKNLKGKKVTIPDVDKEQNILQKGIDEINKVMTKAKAGRGSKDDLKKINDINEKTQKEYNKVAIGAGITVGLAAAITLCIAAIKGYGPFTKKTASNVDEDAGRIGINTDVDADTVAILSHGTSAKSLLSKQKIRSMVNYIQTTFKLSKGAVIARDITDPDHGEGGKRELDKLNKQLFESVEEVDTYSYLESIIENATESQKYTGTSTDDIFNSICEEVVGESGYDLSDINGYFNSLMTESEEDVTESASDVDNYFDALIAESTSDVEDYDMSDIDSFIKNII